MTQTQVDLFPFLPILVSMIGVLVLMLGAMVALQLQPDAEQPTADAATSQPDATSTPAATPTPAPGYVPAAQAEAVRGTIEAARAAIDRLVELLAQADRTAADLAAVQAAVAELERAAAELVKLKAELAAIQAVSNALRDEIGMLIGQITEAQDTIESLRSQLQAPPREEAPIVQVQPAGSDEGTVPRFVECTGLGLVLHSVRDPSEGDGQPMPPDLLKNPGFRKLLHEVKADPQRRQAVIFLIRPEGVTVFERAAALAAEGQVRFGYLPVPSVGKLDLSSYVNPGAADAGGGRSAMRRRRRPSSSDGQITNIDSLLDTLTNVVGILIVVVIFTQLSAAGTVSRIKQQERAASTTQAADPTPTPEPLMLLADFERLQQQSAATEARRQELDATWTQRADTAAADERRLAAARARAAELGPVPTQVVATKTALEQQRLAQVELTRDKQAKQSERALIEEEQSKLEASLVRLRTALMPRVLKLPVLRDPPAGAEPVFFVATINQLYRFDRAALQTMFYAEVARLLEVQDGRQAIKPEVHQKIIDHFTQREIGDKLFLLRPMMAGDDRTLILRYQPRQLVQGESVVELMLPDSTYQKQLSLLDPARHWVRFLVWPDSFDLYNDARLVAESHGLACGWTPYPGGARLDDIIQGPAQGTATIGRD